MLLITAWWNVWRMHRAIWHRHQHEKLMGKVGDYLTQLEEVYANEQ